MKKTPHVCPLNTSPCVHSTRPRVYVQNIAVYAGRHHAHMLKHVCAWCRHTRTRFERTHWDVLSGHTPYTTHTTTHHNNTTTTPNGDRDRERRQKTEKRRRMRRRQDKRREKIHFQCGGAGPFLVDGMLCLVNSGCARVFGLLNSVKYDCSLILSVHFGRSTVF